MRSFSFFEPNSESLVKRVCLTTSSSFSNVSSDFGGLGIEPDVMELSVVLDKEAILSRSFSSPLGVGALEDGYRSIISSSGAGNSVAGKSSWLAEGGIPVGSRSGYASCV